MNYVGSNFGWIEILFVALVAFSFGFYQLWSVNREIRRDREAKSARDSGHPVGEHELDDR